MAQYYAARRAAEGKTGIKVLSSGLEADKETPMPEIIKTLFKKEGIPAVKHVPARPTAEAAAAADLILTMTHAQKTEFLEQYPETSGKVHTLLEYAGFGRADLADPYGREDIFYFEAFRLIKKAVDAVFNKLEQKK
jgi:protein-tyrosine phosphatase